MQFVYCNTKGTGSTRFRVLPLHPPTDPTSTLHLDYFLFLLRVSHLFVLCSFGLPLLLAHPSPFSFHSLIFSFLFFFHFIFPSLFVPFSYSVFLFFFQVLAYWLFIASGANGVLNALKHLSPCKRTWRLLWESLWYKWIQPEEQKGDRDMREYTEIKRK